MKKIIYIILACIIIAGAFMIQTKGLNLDIIYGKNVEIDIYIGEIVELKDIKLIANEVFSEEKLIVQEVELFDDMVSIVIKEKSDDELKGKIEELKTKINEKYGTKITIDDNMTITHNTEIQLYDIVKPYIIPVAIGSCIILFLVTIRYRKLGILKVIGTYILWVIITEATYLSVFAILQIPFNRFVISGGLLLYVVIVTILGIINNKKISNNVQVDKN